MTASLDTVTPTRRHTLVNVYGWRIVYATRDAGPDYDRVVVTKAYRGTPAGGMELTRDEARSHYAAMLRQGFERF